MKISVIVPYYEAEKWIRRCCESLHNNKSEYVRINEYTCDIDEPKDIKLFERFV